MLKISLAGLLAITAIAIASATASVTAEIVEKAVEYELPNGKMAKGVAVYDDEVATADEPAPGVLVIPEWWGLNDYPKLRARMLAEDGYVAFVADMYGEGATTEDPAQAGEWSEAAGQTGLAELAKPALEQLKKLEQVDTDNLAAMGFCFGGNTVVAMAGSEFGNELKAVVSFHGGLSPEAAPQGGDYDGPAMLICHGGADPMDKPEAVAGFFQKCIEAGVPLTIASYPGALHAFTNPKASEIAKERGMEGMIAYDQRAAEESWLAAYDFLVNHFYIINHADMEEDEDGASLEIGD